MDIEHQVRAIPIDDNFQDELVKLQQEGWQIIPGATPVAVYHLMRPKQVPASAGAAVAKMKIDDNKVFIMKSDGSMQRPDGTIIPPGEAIQ